MPQPALHMLLASATLRHWRREPAVAPFPARSAAAANGFLLGSLGPDLGLFPGGAAELSVIAHSGRTGELVRTLFRRAADDTQRAFCWGWLSHALADVAIHPLVNRAAAADADPGGTHSLADHVRNEVGLDAWYGWRHPVLRRLRLRPAFAASNLAFLARALHDTHGYHVTTGQLVRMQSGALRFTQLALHFAVRAARELCWKQGRGDVGAPPATALVWRIASVVSARDSLVHAYLNPTRPAAWLRAGVGDVMRGFNAEMDGWVGRGIDTLPDYNLEDGTLPDAAETVPWPVRQTGAERVA
jgi:hypothetical protein